MDFHDLVELSPSWVVAVRARQGFSGGLLELPGWHGLTRHSEWGVSRPVISFTTILGESGQSSQDADEAKSTGSGAEGGAGWP